MHDAIEFSTRIHTTEILSGSESGDLRDLGAGAEAFIIAMMNG